MLHIDCTRQLSLVGLLKSSIMVGGEDRRHLYLALSTTTSTSSEIVSLDTFHYVSFNKQLDSISSQGCPSPPRLLL